MWRAALIGEKLERDPCSAGCCVTDMVLQIRTARVNRLHIRSLCADMFSVLPTALLVEPRSGDGVSSENVRFRTFVSRVLIECFFRGLRWIG